jgi:hypothetical protein
MNRLARWIFKTTDNEALAFVILAAVLIGFGYLMASITGCSTRSIVITSDMIDATSTTLLYCPEASVTRVVDGNRTVDTSGVETGVGETLRGIADAIFGGGK